MKTKDIGTGRLIEVERRKDGWSAVVHPDGETPSYHNQYPITEDQARDLLGWEKGPRCWVGSRVMVREEVRGSGTSHTFTKLAPEVMPEPPGEITKLRKEWAEMRKELDERTEAAQGPLLEKLRRAENDISCLRVLLRDRDAALEAVKKALQARS